MRRKSVIRRIAALNLGLAVVLLVLLSTASIPISMGQANENAYVVFSAVSSNDPVNTDDPGYDKDVACTEVAIASGNKTLEVTVSNAYPGYSPTISYNMTNNSEVSANVTGFNYTADDPLKLIIKPWPPGDIPIDGTVEGTLGIEIPQEAKQGVTYRFSVTINFEGEESIPAPVPSPRRPSAYIPPRPRPTTEVAGPVCACRIIQLTLSPYEVYADAPVTVGVLITNPCDEPQTCEVILKINGVVEGRKEVVIKPHETKRVTFTISKHTVGTYLIEVNGFGAGTLVVKEMELFPVPPPSMPGPINWLLILLIALGAAALAALITYLVSRKKKQAGALPGD